MIIHLNPSTQIPTNSCLISLEGLWSQNSEYNFTVPASVSVQRGLCVHIPCSFTYNQVERTNPGKLYGYWFQNKDGYQHYFTHSSQRYALGILVATNDKRQKFRTSVENRFQFTGEPEEGNCSFSILNAKSEDAGEYYFRIEDGYLKYSYTTNRFRTHTTLQVLVTALEEPQLGATSVVLSGKEAVYTCLALGPCVKIDAKLSWDTWLTGDKTPQWSQQHSNGSWIYGSNFTFTPSLNDQGKQLSCWVWYPNIWASVKKSIQLEVADPPKTVEISTNATDRGHLGLCSAAAQGDLDSAVVQEGESISLSCNAESRPKPTLSWRKGNKTLKSTRQGKECVLVLSGVRPKDAGEYQCWAETPQGSANKTLRLCVLYPPRTVAFRISQAYRRGQALIQDPPTRVANGTQLTADEGDLLQLLCTAQSNPPSETSWVKGSRTLERHSPSPDTWLKLTNLTVKDAGQYACQAKNSLGSVQGIVQLSIAWSRASSVISGLCGALVAIILCVLCLGLIKFYKQRKVKASSKAGGAEVLNSANGGHQRASDGSVIYSNVSPMVGIVSLDPIGP
ncbi:UNVERIFIED_CONTAM: hypothetical protein K2H54_024342 [Gekko kuhli]